MTGARVAPAAQHMAVSLRLTGTYLLNFGAAPHWMLGRSRQIGKTPPNGEPEAHRHVLRQRRICHSFA
jgi:hypothetical protein